jgi:hypothetical protein
MRKRFGGRVYPTPRNVGTESPLEPLRAAACLVNDLLIPANIMIKSIRDVRKYVRQQRPAKPGEPITVRLHPDQLNQLKAWIAKQDDAPSRPQATRRLLAKALGKK